MAYLVFSCSLNPKSRSKVLADGVYARLEKLGEEVEFIDLAELDLPACDGGACYADPKIEPLRAKIQGADGIIIATPIYNYDANAAAKNMIELTGVAWTNKVVGFLCAAGGRGSYMAIMGLANSLMLDFRSVILPRFVYALETAFEDGALVDSELGERLDELAEALVSFGGALKEICNPEPSAD